MQALKSLTRSDGIMNGSIDTPSDFGKHPPRIQHEGEVRPVHVGEGQKALIDLDAEDATHLLLASDDPVVELWELFLDLVSEFLVSHDHRILADGTHDRLA